GILLRLMGWITSLGDSASLAGVALVATGLLWADRRPRLILPLWITILGALGTTWIGKFAFDRPRPEFIEGFTALSPSFPSAHATGVAAVYGFIAYVVVRDLPGRRARFEVVFWTVVLVALVGF